jgi:hypothetical protein
LHFVHKVTSESAGSLDSKDVVWVHGTVGENLACLNAITLLNRNVLGLSDQVLTWVTEVRSYHDLTLTTGILSEINNAIDVADNSWILRLTSFKELNHSRKTSSNILGLRCSALSLRDNVTGVNIRVVLNDKSNTYWKVVDAAFAVLAVNYDTRTEVAALILSLNDLSLYESGALISTLLHRRFGYVYPLNSTGKVAQDWNSERIPLSEERAWLNLSALFYSETSSVDERMTLTLTTVCLINDKDLSLTAHHNGGSVTPSSETSALKLDCSTVPSLEGGRLSSSERRASDVERSHRELCSRLSDGLRCDYSDSLSNVHQVSTSEVSAVAQGTYTALGLTGEYRADKKCVDASG